MTLTDIGVILSAIVLLGAFITNVVHYSNADTLELILMDTKTRNTATFYHSITTLLSFVFMSAVLLYQLTSGTHFFMTILSGIGCILFALIWLNASSTDYVYFLYNETTPYRIISRIDNDFLLVACRENEKIIKKVVSINLIENTQLYVTKKTLLDKEYSMRKINKKLGLY